MINLIDNIYLDADDSSYMLRIWNGDTRKDGTPRIKSTRFFSNIPDLKRSLSHILTRNAIASSDSLRSLCLKLDGLSEKVDEIGNSITSYLE